MSWVFRDFSSVRTLMLGFVLLGVGFDGLDEFFCFLLKIDWVFPSVVFSDLNVLDWLDSEEFLFKL